MVYTGYPWDIFYEQYIYIFTHVYTSMYMYMYMYIYKYIYIWITTQLFKWDVRDVYSTWTHG